jgi:hypothetical protein
VQFINTGVPRALLRFVCGCTYLDGALKFAKHDDYARWLCFNPFDTFFPMRLHDEHVANCASFATSLAIGSTCNIAIIGNSKDCNDRGCAHLVYRSGSRWIRACQKYVGARQLQTPNRQGMHCAINALSTVFAIANETEVWIGSICPSNNAYNVIDIAEYARLNCATVLECPITSLKFSASGKILAIASAHQCALYQDSDALPYTLALTVSIGAPIALNSMGTICFGASQTTPGYVARADLDFSSASARITETAQVWRTNICCNSMGTDVACDCAASSLLHTRISWEDTHCTVAHDGAIVAQFDLPAQIVNCEMGADGSIALLQLANGTVRQLH